MNSAAEATSLKFGTSGLRGLASDLVGSGAQRHILAFLRYLQSRGDEARTLYVARDLRPSSAAIVGDCAAVAGVLGVRIVDCGVLPTPALALHAIAQGAPSVMVTGSHIPADRNGLKFYTARGEISKTDEAGIIAHLEPNAPPTPAWVEPADGLNAATERYLRRFAGLLPPDALGGWRVGIFEHSSTARDVLGQVLSLYGAEIVKLGRSDDFVAIDTEAYLDPVFAPLRGWIAEHDLDAIVSTDGDGDRPLLMDAEGQFVRGDVLGLLAAQLFGADVVVTPVTSNTAIEATGAFKSVIRTRVGSPHVIAGMEGALAAGGASVFGFEANGGMLLGSQIVSGSKSLGPLMTRDAILPLVGVMGLAARQGRGIAEIVADLPLRAALSERLQNVPIENSNDLLAKLRDEAAAKRFFAPRGQILRIAEIDGLQVWLSDGTMIHYRPSGNAPELRCYVEAETPEAAQSALEWGLDVAKHHCSQASAAGR